jgi:hypothetical protein
MCHIHSVHSMSVVSFLSGVADILLILATTNLEAEHRNSSYHEVPPLTLNISGKAFPIQPNILILTHNKKAYIHSINFCLFDASNR